MAQTFSKYQILRKLGAAGGHLTAFEAQQGGLDRSVELRILNRRIQEDQPAYKRFQREFQVLATLDHPALIKVLDLGAADGRVYYTTQFREAETLRERVKATKGGLDADQVLDWLLPVGDALALLHSKGVLHRDLSLDSIKIDSNTGRAYLATFSLLKVLKLPSLTEKGYKATGGGATFTPEQLNEESETERTDVFLFATLLYQSLTGRFLPTAADALTGASANLFAYEDPSDLARGLSPQLDKTILQALEAAPDDRPESMQAFLSVLRRKRKLMEAKNVARTVGLPTVAAKIPEVEDLAPEIDPRDRDAADVFRDSSKEAVADAYEQVTDWLDETPGRRKFVGGGVALAILATIGLKWMMNPDFGPVTVSSGNFMRAKRTRGRGKSKLDKKALRKEVNRIAKEAADEATSPRTFEKRWRIFKTFVKSLPRKDRLKEFPPSVMANLRVGFYRSPEKASLELDRLLAKAQKLASQAKS